MKEPIDRSHETNSENIDFQGQIDAITDRALSPENIDTYASDALDDLVSLVDEIVSSQNYKFPFSSLENERQALADADVDPDAVERTLDHIAKTAEDIFRIKAISERLRQGGVDVITPPDTVKTPIVRSGGLFERKKIVNRLETVLFVLEKNFGINVDPDTANPEEFFFIPGTVTEDMMRQTPYDIIDLPALNRIINVCDEEGNRTFIFDREKLLENGITLEVLKNMKKPQLKELLAVHEGLGQDVIYSGKFVEEITSLLDYIPINEKDIVTNEETAKLLKPIYETIPEGCLSAAELADHLGVAVATINRSIRAIGSQLGEISRARIGYRFGSIYSPRQQDIIREYLEARGVFAPQPPEGFLSAVEISKLLRISDITVNKVIGELSDELGEQLIARKGRVAVPVFSPEQRVKIEDHLEKRGNLIPQVPEGYMSVNNIAHSLNLSALPVKAAIEELGDQLGEPLETKFYAMKGGAYSPIQQEMIKRRLIDRGTLMEDAPDSFLSARGIAQLTGLNQPAIQRAAEKLGEELGEVMIARVGSNRTAVYSPLQQEKIVNWLEQNMRRRSDSKVDFELAKAALRNA